MILVDINKTSRLFTRFTISGCRIKLLCPQELLIGMLVSLIVCCISSCDSKNNYGKSTISAFSGKTISIPDSIICYIKDKVVDYNFDGAGFKIICFIDSDGCTPCLMKLPLWQHALNDFSSISERPIDFLMVLRTSFRFI